MAPPMLNSTTMFYNFASITMFQSIHGYVPDVDFLSDSCPQPSVSSMPLELLFLLNALADNTFQLACFNPECKNRTKLPSASMCWLISLLLAILGSPLEASSLKADKSHMQGHRMAYEHIMCSVPTEVLLPMHADKSTMSFSEVALFDVHVAQQWKFPAAHHDFFTCWPSSLTHNEVLPSSI